MSDPPLRARRLTHSPNLKGSLTPPLECPTGPHATAERAAKAIQDKLDHLDEAFLFNRSIDIDTYDRHAEKLREELTLARIDRHSGQLDELDVEGILAFAERILPRASDLWVQASLDQRQRF